MKQTAIFTAMLLAALTAGANALPAAPPETATPTAGFTHAIFDGGELDQWRITGCDVTVEDGSLLLKNGNGYVQSHHRYGDFVLELDWKSRQKENYDSGIYFRADVPKGTRPWPTRYQINLKQGDEGNVKLLPGAQSSGLVKPGQWNHFKLTAIGGHAALEINGTPAWKVDGVEARSGYIGLQAEVPLGGQFEFRDIRVTELGYRSLFDGHDLAGWEGASEAADKCWKVEDGLLVCNGHPGPWLRSADQYGDFNLRLEYKLKPGGNSGVYLRVPKGGASRLGAFGRTQRHRGAVARRRRQAIRIQQALPVFRQSVRLGRAEGARRPAGWRVEHAGGQLPGHRVSRDAQRRGGCRRDGEGLPGARAARARADTWVCRTTASTCGSAICTWGPR